VGYVFFSYASEDRARVAEFVRHFQEAGVDVAIDRERIHPGDSISGKINDMIAGSDGAVIFYSARYAQKPWTTEEQDALIFRSVERNSYKIILVLLDKSEPPPLLAHRLWTKGDDPVGLAALFSSNLREAPTHERGAKEIKAWLQTFSDDELERIGLAIQQRLRQSPSATVVPFRSKKAGDIVVHLVRPLAEKFSDTLDFALRVQQKVNLIRNDLRERLAIEDLGVARGAFVLAEREKFRQMEGFRLELRETLDAMVEQVVME
jgi:hypothetical protein